jgi:putative inorganic carbon (HCO3(-)) transporter
MIRSESIVRVVLVLLFTYLVAIGATFNGVLDPQFKIDTLAMVALGAATWLFLHWRRGWVWHRTVLDGVFLLWALAFALSLAANLDVWRRIVMGLWYVGVYVGVWYILHDALANRGVKREMLVDALLITGLIVMLFGYVQSYAWLIHNGAGVLPRPVSTIGNTNALASFLVVLIPFALARFAAARNPLGRIVLGIYSLLAMVLLIFTDSRGAWLGLAAALVVWGALVFAQRDMLSAARLREWWQGQTTLRKLGVSTGSVVFVGIAVVATARFVDSFSQPGRTVELRTWIYETAFRLFAEQPLNGSGLFTFGRGLERLNSLPPLQPHSHAHSIPFLVAAELGILGVVALVATVVVCLQIMRRNWQIGGSANKPLLAGAAASVVGFGVHHLTDTPAMMPVIALVGLLALVLAAAPISPEAIISAGRRRVQPIVIIVLWAALLASGFWSSHVYTEYVDTLKYAVQTSHYRDAAQRLQSVIDTDPSLALYHAQQAYLWGLAAYLDNDADAAQKGIDAYQRFLTLEPYNAIGWTNLAALDWQVQHSSQAIADMQRAVELAPGDAYLAHLLDEYHSGKVDVPKGAFDPLTPDYTFGENIASFQFLRIAITRQFLPQVGYPAASA